MFFIQKGDSSYVCLCSNTILEQAHYWFRNVICCSNDDLNFLQEVQTKVSDVVLGKEKPVEESNPEYEKLKNYIFELENHLSEAQKHAYRLVKRHRGQCFLS